MSVAAARVAARRLVATVRALSPLISEIQEIVGMRQASLSNEAADVRGDVIQLLHIRIDVFEPLAQA